jgi:hypothetical protein
LLGADDDCLSDRAAGAVEQAPKYDRQISFFERVLFGDGRA